MANQVTCSTNWLCCFHYRPLEAHEALPVRQHRVVTESQLKDNEENTEVGYTGRNS